MMSASSIASVLCAAVAWDHYFVFAPLFFVMAAEVGVRRVLGRICVTAGFVFMVPWSYARTVSGTSVVSRPWSSWVAAPCRHLPRRLVASTRYVRSDDVTSELARGPGDTDSSAGGVGSLGVCRSMITTIPR